MCIYKIIIIVFCLSLLAQGQSGGITDKTAAAATDSTKKKTVIDSVRIPQRTDSLQNKAATADTAKKKAVIDTVRFQQQKQFAQQSRVITDSTFLWNDYRYFADFLGSSGISFKRSLGTSGQPEEVLLYGLGNGMISAFEDGELANNRSSGIFNFNYLQGEGVEKIELLPLSRGFLYGPLNNPVSFHAIGTSGISGVPYTRVKYFQAPFLEGFFDFRQQQMFFKKLYFALEVSNRKKDEGYAASGSSSWLASVQLMYPLSKKLTLGAIYRFTKFAPGLFGGVDMDSIKAIYKKPGEVLYDEILAPIATPDRYYSTFQNGLSFSARYLYNENFYNEFVVYGRESVSMFRMNTEDTLGSPGRISINQSVKTAGLKLQHELITDELIVSVNEGIENSTGRDTFYTGNPTYRAWYLSGSATFFPKRNIQPSVFAKIAGNNNNILPGAGADVKVNLFKGISVYAGMSAFQREKGFWTTVKTTFSVAEGRLEYAVSPGEQYHVSVYHYRSADAVGKKDILVAENNSIGKLTVSEDKIEASGIAFSGTKKIGYLSIEGSLSGFIAQNKTGKSAEIPLLSGQAGIYYCNVHFDSSLVIKTGLNARFFSQFTPLAYDLFFNTTYQKAGTAAVAGNADLSYFMAGEIKKRAIVYFTWENILDRKYYLTAYYPMPRRGIRLGITWQLYN